MGEVVEAGPASEIFTNPKKQLTREYLDGSFS
jgi:ABC-type phosphate transport system ATPase subunit